MALEALEIKKNAAPKGKKLKGDANYIAQSKTQENYMDYNFDEAGKNKFFERKTLTKQQWDIIRENIL